MRIKNERELCLYFWYKTLVISTKYMDRKNKKMSETKICSKKNDIESAVNHMKPFLH